MLEVDIYIIGANKFAVKNSSSSSNLFTGDVNFRFLLNKPKQLIIAVQNQLKVTIAGTFGMGFRSF